MTARGWAWAAVCAAGTWACSGAGEVGGPAATGDVFGRCVDGSGAPVAGVDVRWRKSARSVASDAAGRFRLAFSFDAHFATFPGVVELEKAGFQPLTVEVELSHGGAIDLGDLPLE